MHQLMPTYIIFVYALVYFEIGCVRQQAVSHYFFSTHLCNANSETMIRNLIFDFGKVLVDYDYIQVINQIITDADRRKDFCQKIITAEWIDFLDTEEKPFKENIRFMQETYPEYRAELQQFGDRYLDFVIGEVLGMRDLLTKLKAEGFKLYGLSNWCSIVFDVMEKYHGIFTLLDGRVVSCEEKIIKPDPRIFQRLCEKYSLKPEECVFADDKADNIEGARKVGMQAILFHDARQYEQELRKLTNR